MEHTVLDDSATVMRRVFCHDKGRLGTRATWWAVWSAVDLEADNATVEAIADRLCCPLDVAQRSVASLSALGLLDVGPGGVVSRAHVADVAQDVSSSSLSLVPTNEKSKELSCVGADAHDLTWQVPAIVASSGFLANALLLCDYMAEQVAERGDSRAALRARTKAWVLPMEALLRVDEREAEHVRRVLDWLHRGADEPSSFWRLNVLAPSSLRARWERMGQQYAATKAGKPSRQSRVLRGDDGPRLADVIGGHRGDR